MMSKTDEVEPAHPIGWKDDVPENDKLNNLLDEIEKR